MLDQRQSAMFRLAFDKGAGDPEATAAFMALRASLFKTGLDAHSLLASMEDKGLLQRLAAAERRAASAEMAARTAAARSTPDPGLTVIRFGFEKGKMLKDVSPFNLRRLRKWCTDNECWDDLVQDINDFLDE